MLLKGGRLATTELVRWRGRPAVRKRLRMRFRLPVLSAEVDRWLAHREMRQMRRAEGIPGVPRVLARLDRTTFVREYVPGVALPRAERPDRAFFDALMRIVVALHARGITHNDLHKEANVIVTPDGSPALLDFQLSLSFSRDSALFRLLARFDRYHVLKNRRHRLAGGLTAAEEAFFRETAALRRLHRTLVKKPVNLLTRRFFPRALGKLPTDTDP